MWNRFRSIIGSRWILIFCIIYIIVKIVSLFADVGVRLSTSSMNMMSTISVMFVAILSCIFGNFSKCGCLFRIGRFVVLPPLAIMLALFVLYNSAYLEKMFRGIDAGRRNKLSERYHESGLYVVYLDNGLLGISRHSIIVDRVWRIGSIEFYSEIVVIPRRSFGRLVEDSSGRLVLENSGFDDIVVSR